MSQKRIISLLAAGTEIVSALGLEDQLVGISHECDFPESIKNRPVCSTAKFLPGSDSAAIDRQVKEILTDALSIYTLDQEKLKELQPDVVITQSQCEVCAVSLKDVESCLQGVLNTNVEIVSLQPNTLADILNDIQVVSEKLGVSEKGTALVEELQERLDLIRHKLKFVGNKPRVACIEWMSPLMIAGNWTPELIEIAGGIPVLAENGKHSPFIEFEKLSESNPDVIIISPCGFSVERTLQEINVLLELPGWTEIAAVKNNRVFVADGNHYFNRSGPRIVDTVEIIAEILYPKQFVFGYEGKAWLQFGL